MVKKSRMQQLIEAIKAKRWHDANVLTSRILEGKVMARLDEERKGMFKNGFVKECPEDGDGGSPMDNPKLEKEAFPGAAPMFKKKNVKEGDEQPGQDGEQDKDALDEGYYRVTYLNGKKEETLKFQGSASEARAKVASEAGAGKTIVDVETLSYDEYNEE